MSIFLQITPYIFSFLDALGGKKVSNKILNLITNGEKFFFLDKIYDFEKRKLTARLLILLPGKGCEWAEKTGGCTMCGFPAKTREIGKSLSGNDLVALTKIALHMSSAQDVYNVTIFNGGSFLNKNEISLDAQRKILRLLNKIPTIQKIFIETRAEFVTQETIEAIKKEIGDKKLVVAVGLESQDDKIRNGYIRKGLSKQDYERAISVLKQQKIRSVAYVFLKPIYLSEKDAIIETVKTIKYAFSVGTDEIALESAFIQEGTLMERLFKEKKFKPPWLWSIIEVIKETHSLGPVHVGGFNDEPPPIAIPQNCPSCSKFVSEAIEKYRQTYNVECIEYLDCTCKQEWNAELASIN